MLTTIVLITLYIKYTKCDEKSGKEKLNTSEVSNKIIPHCQITESMLVLQTRREKREEKEEEEFTLRNRRRVSVATSGINLSARGREQDGWLRERQSRNEKKERKNRMR